MRIMDSANVPAQRIVTIVRVLHEQRRSWTYCPPETGEPGKPYIENFEFTQSMRIDFYVSAWTSRLCLFCAFFDSGITVWSKMFHGLSNGERGPKPRFFYVLLVLCVFSNGDISGSTLVLLTSCATSVSFHGRGVHLFNSVAVRADTKRKDRTYVS